MQRVGNPDRPSVHGLKKMGAANQRSSLEIMENMD